MPLIRQVGVCVVCGPVSGWYNHQHATTTASTYAVQLIQNNSQIINCLSHQNNLCSLLTYHINVTLLTN